MQYAPEMCNLITNKNSYSITIADNYNYFISNKNSINIIKQTLHLFNGTSNRELNYDISNHLHINFTSFDLIYYYFIFEITMLASQI